MSEREERRLGRNEALVRDVNEAVEEVGSAWFRSDEPMEFRCECSSDDCRERVTFTRREYEALRGEGRRFVVVPGHEDERIERVVGRVRDYLVVEKTGPAGDVADATDPR